MCFYVCVTRSSQSYATVLQFPSRPNYNWSDMNYCRRLFFSVLYSNLFRIPWSLCISSLYKCACSQSQLMSKASLSADLMLRDVHKRCLWLDVTSTPITVMAQLTFAYIVVQSTSVTCVTDIVFLPAVQHCSSSSIHKTLKNWFILHWKSVSKTGKLQTLHDVLWFDMKELYFV